MAIGGKGSAVIGRLDVPAIRAGLVVCWLFFLCMAIYSLAAGLYLPGALYITAMLALAGFLVGLLRSNSYPVTLWRFESVFFLVWMVGLRLVGGGFNHAMDATAVLIAILAVTLGSGTEKRLVIGVSLLLPAIVKAGAAAWPSLFYFPVSIRTAKLGAGLELLAVAVVATLLLDRIIAAYFHERIEAREKQEALSLLITVDGMTGLSNRSGILEKLDAEVARARRYGHPLSIVMIDVDGLKGANDSRGHLVGDEVLRAVAVVMRDTLTSPGQAGRYGGDEFLLVLPEMTLTQAESLAERIRAAVESIGTGMSVKVSISAGVAEYRDENAGELIDAADTRLYIAKHAGRNLVVSSS